MSSDILTVTTPYADVMALAQGYINRADGERLLLPLEAEQSQGDGLRFVVLLADGTPAFAGAGLCVQVSDQGDTVAPDQRYETLLDSLQFDEASRRVYDYLVAVRLAAYSQPGAETQTGPAEAQSSVDEDLEALAGETPVPAEAPTEALGYEDEATAIVSPGALAAERERVESAASFESTESFENVEAEVAFDDAGGEEPAPWSTEGAAEEPAPWPAESAVAEAAAPEEDAGSLQVPPYEPPPSVASYPSQPSYAMPDQPSMPSFVPPPIPTGILTRRARAAHWQPTPPRRPSARPSSGLFRYPAGALPRPARPPHPDLDPAYRIAPAPRPQR